MTPNVVTRTAHLLIFFVMIHEPWHHGTVCKLALSLLHQIPRFFKSNGRERFFSQMAVIQVFSQMGTHSDQTPTPERPGPG